MIPILRHSAGFCAFVLVLVAGSTVVSASPWEDVQAFEADRVPVLNAAPYKPEPKSTPWGGLYAGLHAAAVILPDTKFVGNGSELNYSFDPGFTLGGSFGYAFNFGLRLETEVSYRVVQAKNFELSGATFTGSGNIDSVSGMLNSWFDIKFLSFLLGDWIPYVGGGAGVVHAWSNVGNIGIPIVLATDDKFAWQGGAGFAYRIHDSILFSIDYRFFRTFGSFSFDDPYYAEPFKAKYKVHSITFGFRGFF